MARRPSTSPDLKQQILEAAVSLFAEEGLDALSMRKVAARVGCSATAIYLYFENKEDLLDALVRQEFLHLASAMESLRAIPDPIERLHAFSRAYVTFALSKPDHYRFVFMTLRPHPSPEALADHNRAEVNPYLMAKEAAEEAIQKGQLRKGIDPHLVAQILVNAVHGALSLHLVSFTDPWLPWHPVEERTALIMATLLKGLKD